MLLWWRSCTFEVEGGNGHPRLTATALVCPSPQPCIFSSLSHSTSIIRQTILLIHPHPNYQSPPNHNISNHTKPTLYPWRSISSLSGLRWCSIAEYGRWITAPIFSCFLLLLLSFCFGMAWISFQLCQISPSLLPWFCQLFDIYSGDCYISLVSFLVMRIVIVLPSTLNLLLLPYYLECSFGKWMCREKKYASTQQ